MKRQIVLNYKPNDLPTNHGEVGLSSSCDCVICQQWKTAEELQRALSVVSSGSLMPEINREYVLSASSKPARFTMTIDTTHMTQQDTMCMTVYQLSGNYRPVWQTTMTDQQNKPFKRSPTLAMELPSKFTIQQTGGTPRPYDWIVQHARSCTCTDCRNYRVAENRALAASNRRDLLSEIAFHAQHDPSVLKGNWQLWLAEEFSNRERTEGWWGTRMLYNPIGWWLRRFQTWCQEISGAARSYYAGPSWDVSQAAWFAVVSDGPRKD